MATNMIGIYADAIRKNLTPDLLKAGYDYDFDNPTKNFCYVATEAMYHLFAGKAGYYPVRATSYNGIVHWWLEDKHGDRIDVTAEQFELVGESPPYSSGKSGGFLTKEPSKRCKVLMARVKETLKEHSENRYKEVSHFIKESDIRKLMD